MHHSRRRILVLTLVSPPLGMEIHMWKKNINQVFGSLKVSHIWSLLKVLFSIPVWSALIRSIAIAFCRSVMNLALTGLSGRKIPTAIAQTKVIAPVIQKNHLHLSSPAMNPIAYPIGPVKITERPVYMRPVRIGCSRLVYHIPRIKKFPGTIGASSIPRRTRTAIKVSKFFANPVPMRTIAQISWT